MILKAQFEEHEHVPPRVWEQCRKALAHVLDSYGFNVTIREDRTSEMEANVRYWAWAAEMRAKRDDFPKTAAEAEVGGDVDPS